MSRFDNRTIEQFKKDIKFGTMIENLWMKHSFDSIKKSNIYPDTVSYKENGIDNSGEYQKKSNGNADFIITGNKDHLLEIKWCPTKGKVSFKNADLINYIKQSADILLIYNSGEETLKQPKDTDFDKHWDKIINNIKNIKWAIINTKSINNIVKKEKLINIRYMGNKPGFIIYEKDFEKYFTLRNFE